MRYEGKNIMNNLNCKMQAHARVCKENKLEEKIWHLLRKFCDKRWEFEGSYRKSGGTYQGDNTDILKDDSP